MIKVAGKEHPWREGLTVADLLNELADDYQYAVVRINENYISKINFEKTTIPDETEVFLIPMIAGG
jgi:thiamine biosynthesis protein ThiS